MDEYEVDDSQGRTVRVRLPGTMLPTLANLQRAYELQSGNSLLGSRSAKAGPPPRLAFQQNPTVVRLRKKIPPPENALTGQQSKRVPTQEEIYQEKRAKKPLPQLMQETQAAQRRAQEKTKAFQTQQYQRNVIDKGGSAFGVQKAREEQLQKMADYAESIARGYGGYGSAGGIPYTEKNLADRDAHRQASLEAIPLALSAYVPANTAIQGGRLITAGLLKMGVRPALAKTAGVVLSVPIAGGAMQALDRVRRAMVNGGNPTAFDKARERFHKEHPVAATIAEGVPGFLYGAGIDKATALANAGIGAGMDLFNQYQNYLNDPEAESFQPNFWTALAAGGMSAAQSRPTQYMDTLVAGVGGQGGRRVPDLDSLTGLSAARSRYPGVPGYPPLSSRRFSVMDEIPVFRNPYPSQPQLGPRGIVLGPNLGMSGGGGGGGANRPRGVPQTDWERLFPGIPRQGEALRRVDDPLAPLAAAQIGSDVYDLIEAKRIWGDENYPEDLADSIVDHGYLSRPFVAAMEGKDNVFLPMPSTSGDNYLPDLLAERLHDDFNGEILYKVAEPLHRKEAKKKEGVEKIARPSQYEILRDISNLAGRNVYVVDDFFTTGDSTVHFQEALANAGLPNTRVAALGATSPFKPGVSDLIYATRTLASLTDTPPEAIAPVVQAFFMRYGRGMINRLFKPLENAPERQAKRDARQILNILVSRTRGTVP